LVYSLDPSRHLVRILLREQPALEEVEAVLDQLLADPQFGPDFGVLVDRWRLVAEPDETYVRGAIELIAERGERFATTRFAAVTAHRTGYRMGRLMMEPFAERHGVAYRVFMDEAEALTWLSGGRP
jgi:hypothetical protein